MAVIKFTNSKSGLKKILRYVTQSEKTDFRLVSGQECMPETALEEMRAIKRMHGKEHGRQYIHIVQAFHPDEDITHEQAHEIGRQLAARFSGYQAVIATHKDRDHVHTHIVLNSVAYETGRKFQQSRQEMQAVKDFSDSLCRAAGLSVIEKREESAHITQDEYHAAIKGESWKFALMNAIDHAMADSASRAEFIAAMERTGYGVAWQESRKHITYTTPEGMKCRDNKLHDPKYLKEAMEHKLCNREAQAPERGWGIGLANGDSKSGDENGGKRENGSYSENDRARDEGRDDAAIIGQQAYLDYGASAPRVHPMPGHVSTTRGMERDDGAVRRASSDDSCVGGYDYERIGADTGGEQQGTNEHPERDARPARRESYGSDALVRYDTAADRAIGAGTSGERRAAENIGEKDVSDDGGRSRAWGCDCERSLDDLHMTPVRNVDAELERQAQKRKRRSRGIEL